jgi:hypothetical protein
VIAIIDDDPPEGEPLAGAPEGPRNGAWRHGGRSSKVLAMRAMERLLLRMAREALEN